MHDGMDSVETRQRLFVKPRAPQQNQEHCLYLDKEEEISPLSLMECTPEVSKAAAKPQKSGLKYTRHDSSVELAKAALEDMIHTSRALHTL